MQVRPPDSATLIEAGLDLWETSADRSVALVTPAQVAMLRSSGHEVVITRAFPLGRRASAATFGPGGFRGYSAILAELRAVAAARPDLVTLQDLGPSWETAHNLADRRVWAARVTGPGSATDRPAVLYLGAYHAREVVTPELTLRTLHLFVDDYGRDPLLTHLVDTRQIWIVPIVNPDGYARVEAGAEWWRKNANATAACGVNPGTSANPNHPGVDLNRNHSYGWNAGGASSDPCGETYQGPSATSEPEIQAIQGLVASAPFTTLLTWHAYGNLVLWPWGYRSDPQGADPVLNAFGARLSTLTGYRGGAGGAALYLTTGELTDWAWATRGIGAVTIEVGSSADAPDGNPFAPPYRQVEQYWNENKPAALYMARVGDRLSRALAPDLDRVETTLALGAASGRAVANIAPGPTAAAAELFVDTPGAEGTGRPATLAPSGQAATWSFTTAGLAPGRHAVFVRARDAAARWGPLSAASLPVGRQSLFLPTGPGRAAIAP